MTNPETWADVLRFTREFPDTDYWNGWRETICPVLNEALDHGYDRLFRAGTSMHHIILSTIDHHGLTGEPHVTIRVAEESKVQIAYSTASLHFHPPIESAIVDSQAAFSPLTRYLRHLWEETVPEPIPEELRKRRTEPNKPAHDDREQCV